MAKLESHHVVPAPQGGWNLKKGGSSRATKHFEKKQEAIDFARKVSKNQGSELFIHNEDGKIAKRDSHCSKDPYPPEG